jgi:hypothetical protein
MLEPRGGIEFFIGNFLLGLILELNIGAFFKKYGTFQWRRFVGYFWLLLAFRWILIFIKEVFI